MSVRRLTLRAGVTAATLAAAAAPMFLLGAGSSVDAADQLCETAIVSGTLAQSQLIQKCINYSGAPLCHPEEAGFGTAIDAYAEVCVPWPVGSAGNSELVTDGT